MTCAPIQNLMEVEGVKRKIRSEPIIPKTTSDNCLMPII